MNTKKRLLEIDVLRGVAAIGVILFHYTTRYNQKYGHSDDVLMYLPQGFYGVELFFIISGFVIFTSLDKIKSGSEFVIGRFSRLYPAYWTCLILTYTIVNIAGLPNYTISWDVAIINLSMFQVFFNVPNVDGVYWTLEIELCFYIIMFVLYQTKLLKYIYQISIIWLILMVLTIILEKQGNIIIESRIGILLFLKSQKIIFANLFLIGIMFYKKYQKGLSIKEYFIITACILVYKLQHYWSETLLIIFFAVLFHLIIDNKMSFIIQKPLLFMGNISYSLYLIHQNVGYVIINHFYKFGINPNISICVALIISILLAAIITFKIEKPIMRFIKKMI
ncbi:acyltransferase family protein [Nostoc sp. LEGE 12450]|uniref:acyltransferase family protein n=1 Tax=Nostoc sp. LEGE 12450 TaxID=1828643 RepID=UPI00187F4EF1|nr:acyltransferase [Nostoc sp. LEGE 12450]MBE8985831.1 acyltransferase [Nostoc sp. LEGE 12450]